MGLKVDEDDLAVEGVHPKAEVVHVVASHDPGGGNEIHQGPPRPELKLAPKYPLKVKYYL